MAAELEKEYNVKTTKDKIGHHIHYDDIVQVRHCCY